jgi:sulfur-oxidizing protein SoxX
VKTVSLRGLALIAVSSAVTAIAPAPVTATAASPRAAAVMMRPLTATPGDAARGRDIALDKNLGGCVLCHALPGADGVVAEPYGTLGPSLVDVGSRLSAAQLRQRIVDPTRVDRRAAMPAYFRSTDLQRVAPAYRGKTILTAQQVEDVVSWLVGLR